MTVVLNWKEKAEVLRGYWDAFGPFRFVVETGVWNGNGSLMQFRSADTEYVGVELNRASAEMAWAKGYDVRVGDTRTLLPFVLAARDAPALLWLDAHDSREGGDERDTCPLLAELDAIVAWPHHFRSVVLIDDIRCCELPEWPSADEIDAVVGGRWDAQLADDILRLTPW